MSPRDDPRLANIAPTLELALVSPQVEHDADVPPSALNASSAVVDRSAASSAPALDPPPRSKRKKSRAKEGQR